MAFFPFVLISRVRDPNWKLDFFPSSLLLARSELQFLLTCPMRLTKAVLRFSTFKPPLSVQLLCCLVSLLWSHSCLIWKAAFKCQAYLSASLLSRMLVCKSQLDASIALHSLQKLFFKHLYFICLSSCSQQKVGLTQANSPSLELEVSNIFLFHVLSRFS